MVEAELVERVRELRNAGQSPKQIARTLGVQPSAINPLIRQIARERNEAVVDEVVECWISPGWSNGLTFERHPDWPDADADTQISGLVNVLVSRTRRGGNARMCGYLVDVHCLGVKNTVGPVDMHTKRVFEYSRSFFAAYNATPLSVPLELAQNIVYGAVRYARELGFEPHPDYAAAKDHLGAWTGPSEIGFGRDGKPSYVAGPYDDAGQVLATLRNAVGPDNFHFSVGLPVT